jgi:hypothetical protein
MLELMRSAPERYATVRAALRYRGNGPTIKALRERYLLYRYNLHDRRGNAPEAPGRRVHHHGYDQGEHNPESEPGKRDVICTLGGYIS